MSWVKKTLDAIKKKQDVQVRPHGGSMRGRIESGQLVTIQPAGIDDIQVNDIVFVRWRGNYLLHIAKEISEERVLIGINVGKINGWVKGEDVLGKVTVISD